MSKGLRGSTRTAAFLDGHRGEGDENRSRVDERDREEAADLLGVVECVVPAQWGKGNSTGSPERTFLRVVLASGLHELVLFPPGHEVHEAAMAWLMEDDDNANLCSFVQLCSVFDLDYCQVRRLVLERLAAGTFEITREARIPDVRAKALRAAA